MEEENKKTGGEIHPFSTHEKAYVFAPLIVFLLYAMYLLALSTKPFLVKWLEGCFSLFIALVFCNIIKKGVLDKARERRECDPDGGESPDSAGKC